MVVAKDYNEAGHQPSTRKSQGRYLISLDTVQSRGIIKDSQGQRQQSSH